MLDHHKAIKYEIFGLFYKVQQFFGIFIEDFTQSDPTISSVDILSLNIF